MGLPWETADEKVSVTSSTSVLTAILFMWVPPGEKDVVSNRKWNPEFEGWNENLAFAAGNYHRRYAMNKEVIV